MRLVGMGAKPPPLPPHPCKATPPAPKDPKAPKASKAIKEAVELYPNRLAFRRTAQRPMGPVKLCKATNSLILQHIEKRVRLMSR